MSKIFKIIILVFTIIFFMNLKISSAEEKIKIGILVPMTGNNKELGQSIVKATKLALKDINTDKIEPKLDYELEVKKAIKKSKIKIVKHHIYDTEPTKLTKQIEKITNYKVRKQNVLDEIKRIEKSDLPESSKEIRIKQLEKRYTLGKVNFNSVVIADFDESLKSVATSLLYSDVSPNKKYFITLNQWFNESLIQEKSLQPIYYPSINKKNWEIYKDRFHKKFKKNPNHLSLLSYDLIGLIYYLSLKNDFLTTDPQKLFKKENSFKGKIGVFNIKNNEINHLLNFYKIEKREIKEIF